MEPKATELSERERTIAERYAKGETYREIANALFIAPATVRNHLANIYRKTSVNNKLELISALVATGPSSKSVSAEVTGLLDAETLPHLLLEVPVAHADRGVERELLALADLGLAHLVVELLQREHSERHVAGLVGHHVAQEVLQQGLFGQHLHPTEGRQGQPLTRDRPHAQALPQDRDLRLWARCLLEGSLGGPQGLVAHLRSRRIRRAAL